ncbi:hypothetical protein HHK36_007588 [Tetracentron sinense]|uniref:MADS-box domain-containing protein n=1 Tax=Tetracentron sinense TaxID=13715 RepID=A0A834ZMQ5_TETSI|nr:hypothetical protein HHK36_007588 [Tetracentron sinense]
MKKAHELTLLCDIDLALIVFSSKGKLYEFCSGNSLEKILERYRSYSDAEGKVSRNIHEPACKLETLVSPDDEKCSFEPFQQNRHLEGQNFDQLNVTELVQLEQQLDAALRQTRSIKACSGTLFSEKKLKEDNKLMEEEVAAMANDDDQNQQIDLNDTTIPPQQGTLRLL